MDKESFKTILFLGYNVLQTDIITRSLLFLFCEPSRKSSYDTSLSFNFLANLSYFKLCSSKKFFFDSLYFGFMVIILYSTL